MRPYRNIRLIEAPDVADIKGDARKSSIGRIRRGEKRLLKNGEERICRNDRGYASPHTKAGIRRALKKADRNRGDQSARYCLSAEARII